MKRLLLIIIASLSLCACNTDKVEHDLAERVETQRIIDELNMNNTAMLQYRNAHNIK